MAAHLPPRGWLRAYQDAPEILDAFARAEDPDGLVVDALCAAVGDLTGATVLELGCGTCRLSRALATASHAATWMGLDASAPLLTLASTHAPSLNLLRARAQDLPLVDACCDVLFAAWFCAYLHPQALQASLRECARVLRPGGCLWAVENAPSKAGSHQMPCDGHVADLLAQGFQVVTEISTELRFENAFCAREITQFLMGEMAPEPDVEGRIGHRVVLLKRCGL